MSKEGWRALCVSFVLGLVIWCGMAWAAYKALG